MAKFHLRTEQVIQGDFTIKPINLMVIFQVNCPGCFIYALPLAAQLHAQYGDRINILGLSTAFEDLDLNTVENTQKLLQSGEMVGKTRKYFQHQQKNKPDQIQDNQTEQNQPQENQTVQNQTERYTVPLEFAIAFDQETFYLNALPGTPTWIMFDQEYNILANWFGHKPKSQIENILNRYVPAQRA